MYNSVLYVYNIMKNNAIYFIYMYCKLDKFYSIELASNSFI